MTDTITSTAAPTTEQRVAALLDRFPADWPACLSIPERWLDRVLALADELAGIDPGFQVAQIKEKFGGLRFYLAETEAACCAALTEKLAVPNEDEGPEYDAWEAAWAAHDGSQEHQAGVSAHVRVHAALDRAITAAEAASYGWQ